MKIENFAGTLTGKTVLITGAGGGIGFETAKNFAIMGARVLILEINEELGQQAEQQINRLCPGSTVFYPIDLGDEAAITQAKDWVYANFGCPDILFHNAAILPLGNIGHVTGSDWDLGYRVNFKAPVLLTGCFLEQMKQRDSGVFVFVSSSGAAAGMGAYEIFKTAQVELSSTLAMELEGTHLYSYVIGPGLVKTKTAMRSIEVVAKGMGISLDEFYEMNASHIISVEDAALGFACSVLRAEEFNGQELGSIQVLHAMEPAEEAPETAMCNPTLLAKVCDTYESQYFGWKERNVFERQWVLRDFRKTVGQSADEVYTALQSLKTVGGKLTAGDRELLKCLIIYWEHQFDLLQGFEKNKKKLQENSAIIRGWIADIEGCTSR